MTDRYWPLTTDRRVTSPFGWRGSEFHTGVDFGRDGGSGGMPVYAVQSGTVLYAGAAQGYGGPDPCGWLVIDSDDSQGGGVWEYGHIRRLDGVRVGSKVVAGQQIAVINPDTNTNGGSARDPIAPHLHLSYMPREYNQKAKADPLPRLSGANEPPAIKEKTVAIASTEKKLDYSRATVAQETGWWCGPAMVQNMLSTRGISVPEAELARQIEAIENPGRGDDFDGTDHIGLAVQVLNKYLPEAKYTVVEMPNDPPTPAQVELLWQRICASVDAGYPIAANIVSPPNNRFKPAKGSIPFAYPPGVEIKHYVMAAGKDESDSVRPVWIGDSGFSPFGGWVTLASLASLIPPKGYAYPAGVIAAPKPAPPKPAPPVTAPPPIVIPPTPQLVWDDRTELEWLAFIGDDTALVEVLRLADAGDPRAILVINYIDAIDRDRLELLETKG